MFLLGLYIGGDLSFIPCQPPFFILILLQLHCFISLAIIEVNASATGVIKKRVNIGLIINIVIIIQSNWIIISHKYYIELFKDQVKDVHSPLYNDDEKAS